MPAGPMLPKNPRVILPTGPDELIHFSTLLLPKPLTRERLFYTALFARLHVEAVLLDFFNDVFLLHFPLKSPQCIFQRFTFLYDYFCHADITPRSADTVPLKHMFTLEESPYYLHCPLLLAKPQPEVKDCFCPPGAGFGPRSPAPGPLSITKTIPVDSPNL